MLKFYMDKHDFIKLLESNSPNTVQEALSNMGIVFPVEKVGIGNYATVYKDSARNIARFSASKTDIFIDRMIADSGYGAQIFSTDTLVLNDFHTGICYISFTLREDVANLQSAKCAFDVDDILYAPTEFLEMFPDGIHNDLAVYYEESGGKHRNPELGNMLDHLFGFRLRPESLSNFFRSLHSYLQNDAVKTTGILALHNKHFAFLYSKNANRFSANTDLWIGLLQLCKAATNSEFRPILTSIIAGLIAFEDIVGFFPYDCQHKNLGIHNGRVVMRDYYYIGEVYKNLQIYLEAEWGHLVKNHMLISQNVNTALRK